VVEKHYRSVVKAISWRAIATFTTMFLVFFFTGDLVLMVEVGFLEVILKMLFYYLHERAWGKMSWGIVEEVLEDVVENVVDEEVEQK